MVFNIVNSPGLENSIKFFFASGKKKKKKKKKSPSSTTWKIGIISLPVSTELRD